MEGPACVVDDTRGPFFCFPPSLYLTVVPEIRLSCADRVFACIFYLLCTKPHFLFLLHPALIARYRRSATLAPVILDRDEQQRAAPCQCQQQHYRQHPTKTGHYLVLNLPWPTLRIILRFKFIN